MNKINRFENKLQSFQEGIDYTAEKNEKTTNYTIYNKDLAQNIARQWQKEGFFQDFSKSTVASSSNLEDGNKINEEIFYGWREEVPRGKINGEVKQVFYHWKIEEKQKPRAKNPPNSDKQEHRIEKENIQQNLSQESENKSAKAEKSIQSDKNQELVKNNKFPTGWIVGGGIMSVAVVLIIAAVIKLKNKKRK